MSKARFKVMPSGRRSGKTELLKRKMINAAISHTRWSSARFVLAAPTFNQAKRIFWDDIKALSPSGLVIDISETNLIIKYFNGATITVMGMEKPARIEGPPLDGIGMDEYANMRPEVWPKHVRPALSTQGRLGWADFIGVPEGRNHYYKLWRYACSARSDWEGFTWPSSDILDPEEIASAKEELDELSFQQEYEASFVNFTGRAYYPFDLATHATLELPYDPKADLIFCFDFNVSPGVAVVIQETKINDKPATCVIGEVWIPTNSNTPAVCRRLVKDWGKHEGRVLCYGDATGGARGTAKVRGSDWDLITAELKGKFKEVRIRVPRKNPPERVRVNCLNSRIKATDGTVKLYVDPITAPYTVEDLEGVVMLEGGAGEIDKRSGEELTHLTDALGYYIHRKHPVMGGHKTRTVSTG